MRRDIAVQRAALICVTLLGSLDLLIHYSSLIIFFMSLVSHRGPNCFYVTLGANKYFRINISIMKDQIFSFHFCIESLWSFVLVHLGV